MITIAFYYLFVTTLKNINSKEFFKVLLYCKTMFLNNIPFEKQYSFESSFQEKYTPGGQFLSI